MLVSGGVGEGKDTKEEKGKKGKGDRKKLTRLLFRFIKKFINGLKNGSDFLWT